MAARFARLGHRPAQLEQGARELVALVVLGQEPGRARPGLDRLGAPPARERDGARRAMGDRVLEPVVREACEPQGRLAGAIRLVEAAGRGEGFRAAALELDHQVALGGEARGEPQRLVVLGERVLDVTTVVLELAQELERQGALALGSS